MKKSTTIRNRTLEEARFFIDNKSTVRATAEAFSKKYDYVSKSTVHKDLTQRLPDFSTTLYEEVLEIISINTKERALRGGEATKKKYKSLNM